MGAVTRKSDHLSEEHRRIAIDALIQFFEKERDEQIGRIAAEQLLNFFLESVGPNLFNSGVVSAKKALESRMDEWRYDLDDLLET